MYSVNKEIVVMETGDKIITPEGFCFAFAARTEVYKRGGYMSESMFGDYLDHQHRRPLYALGYSWTNERKDR